MYPAASDPLLGQTVAGRYRVLRLIGKGGAGRIYEVQHLKLRRTFAMKRLADAQHPEALARFQREAEAIASLRHPNVVTVTDWETLPDGSPCIIMELLRGTDLHDHLVRTGPMPWAALGRIADEVMSALSVAHRAGIVHRDLKPPNIFLAEDDAGESQAKLLDFGVSKMRQGADVLTTQQGERLLGTPLYMSPEQANGHLEAVGPSSDVWAMGAILYEMAAAKRAFEGVGTPQVLYRIIHGAPDPLPQHRPDAPAAFVELIERTLSREAAQRIQSIDELRRGLREALQPIAPSAFPEALPGLGTPKPELSPAVAAAPPTVVRTEFVALPPRRRSRVFVATLAGSIAFALAGVVLWLTSRPPGAAAAAAPSPMPAIANPAPPTPPAPSPVAPPETPVAVANAPAPSPAATPAPTPSPTGEAKHKRHPAAKAAARPKAKAHKAPGPLLP